MPQLTIREIMQEGHRTAVANGFYENPPSVPTAIALMHSELSEALEADRLGDDNSALAEEFADAIIRICEFCEYLNLNLEGAIREKMLRNRNRGYRHGGKKY